MPSRSTQSGRSYLIIPHTKKKEYFILYYRHQLNLTVVERYVVKYVNGMGRCVLLFANINQLGFSRLLSVLIGRYINSPAGVAGCSKELP